MLRQCTIGTWCGFDILSTTKSKISLVETKLMVLKTRLQFSSGTILRYFARVICNYMYSQNVEPDPTTSCGPYSPAGKSNHVGDDGSWRVRGDDENHDTIGMIIIDGDGNAVSGTSTNGLNYKVPGWAHISTQYRYACIIH